MALGRAGVLCIHPIYVLYLKECFFITYRGQVEIILGVSLLIHEGDRSIIVDVEKSELSAGDIGDIAVMRGGAHILERHQGRRNGVYHRPIKQHGQQACLLQMMLFSESKRDRIMASTQHRGQGPLFQASTRIFGLLLNRFVPRTSCQ